MFHSFVRADVGHFWIVLVSLFVLDLAAVRALLNIPDDVTPVGVISIGHGAPDMRSPSLKRGRKPWEDYVHREGW